MKPEEIKRIYEKYGGLITYKGIESYIDDLEHWIVNGEPMNLNTAQIETIIDMGVNMAVAGIGGDPMEAIEQILNKPKFIY